MTHRLGVYWCPGHGRPGDLEYMRQLQPPAIRILDPDVQQISNVHVACPNALILPRDWALSEQKRDVDGWPEQTGNRHANEWRRKLTDWRNQARERGLPFPPDNQIVVVGINEPNDGVGIMAQVRYTVALCEEARALGLTVSALNLGVGWPGNTGPDTPPNWGPYAQALAAIERGGHYLTLHEYWYDQPGNGWGWLAGRHTKVPSAYVGRILIGECGIDRYVDKARWDNEGGNRGWRGNVEPQAYAMQLTWYANQCDRRVVAVLPFLTDYRSREWESFDTAEAHPYIVELAHAQDEQPHEVHIPAVVVQPVAPEVEPSPHGSNWERSLAFVRRMEGGWADNPADPGGATMYGITLGTFIRWRQAQRQGTPSKEDLRAITDAEANRIYWEWYWQASGADKMAWPMCLAHFDLAVNGGVGRAYEAYAAAGHDFLRYMAWRLRWYTRIEGWPVFGAAWVRRCAELLDAAR